MQNVDIDIDQLVQKLLKISASRFMPIKGNSLTETEIQHLCNQVKEIFLKEPTLLELEAPIKICGTAL